jgi:hypothetical protein
MPFDWSVGRIKYRIALILTEFPWMRRHELVSKDRFPGYDRDFIDACVDAMVADGDLKEVDGKLKVDQYVV